MGGMFDDDDDFTSDTSSGGSDSSSDEEESDEDAEKNDPTDEYHEELTLPIIVVTSEDDGLDTTSEIEAGDSSGTSGELDDDNGEADDSGGDENENGSTPSSSVEDSEDDGASEGGSDEEDSSGCDSDSELTLPGEAEADTPPSESEGSDADHEDDGKDAASEELQDGDDQQNEDQQEKASGDAGHSGSGEPSTSPSAQDGGGTGLASTGGEAVGGSGGSSSSASSGGPGSGSSDQTTQIVNDTISQLGQFLKDHETAVAVATLAASLTAGGLALRGAILAGEALTAAQAYGTAMSLSATSTSVIVASTYLGTMATGGNTQVVKDAGALAFAAGREAARNSVVHGGSTEQVKAAANGASSLPGTTPSTGHTLPSGALKATTKASEILNDFMSILQVVQNENETRSTGQRK